MNSNRRCQRAKVLVKVHHDGLIEVFGDRHEVDIYCINVPFIAAKPEYERRCEEYLDLWIPWRFREVNHPSNLAATHMFETVKPSDIHRRQVDLLIVKEFKRREAERRRAEQQAKLPCVAMDATTSGKENT